MKLYHTTSAMSAEAILRDGFADTTGYYGCLRDTEPLPFTGVWFADRPVGVSEGCADEPVLGAPVFVVEMNEAAISDYEIGDSPQTYREWCLPAELVNPRPRRVIYDPLDEADPNVPWWEDA